ncbi:NAD(P)/FAD-dependent oxidoreductase [Candidatus Chlorohelix sp.]|uniref:NAD(P)/FAD-dependent oxidoreductase n=1 Tax=Candidatus Chlorohelix sp. TaxID=3139201 RepID=UPI0030502061
MKLGVIGGGALGLTVALRRAQAGDEVVIFEKGQESGGLAASFPVTAKGKDGSHLEKYYHHIFGTDKDIIRLIDELGLTSEMVWKKPNSAILRDGKIFRLDGVVSILRLKPIPFIDRIRMGVVGLYLKLEGNYQRLAKTTANAWVQKWMGKNSYEVVWKPQLLNKFGDKYDQIAMPWLWSRIHERTFALGYMQGGFNKFYVALEKAVKKAGGQVRFGANISDIKPKPDGKVSITEGGQEYIFDKVVTTVPTRVFTKMAESSLPQSYIEKYGGANSVEHYGAQVVVLSLKRSVMPAYWLSITDPGYPFLAMVEHTNFMPTSDYDGQHLLYMGNYLPHTHPYFSKTAEEMVKEFIPAIKRINPDFDESWINRFWVWGGPYAQPIVTMDYYSKLPPHETPIPNVYLANMAHVYPQDRGQNYSIKLGEKIAKLL